MKKFMILAFIGLFFYQAIYADEVNKLHWDNTTKEDCKEHKRRVQFEKQKTLNEMLSSKSWVLEAYTLQDRYGNTVNIQPSINFVAMNGNEATVQLGFDHRIGPNGLGGITLEGNVSEYEINQNKKAHSGANARLFISGASSGHLSLMVHAGVDGFARATVSDNFGNRLTYIGRIVPMEESIFYKGQTMI